MTCVVGLVHKNIVWIGGDSAGTNGAFNQDRRADKKVFIKDDFIFGFCGSFRMGQLLQYSSKIPKQKQNQNDFQFLVNDFVNAIKECFDKENKNKNHDDPRLIEPMFLFGYRRNLYSMEQDYQIAKSNENFYAMGSGHDLAKGAMHASTTINDPKRRILLSLKAASIGNAAVRPPYVILKL